LFSLFATGVVDTGGNLPQVSRTPAVLMAKFAAGVVDNGGEYLSKFSKKCEMTLMLFSGA
jgi:hypothetical protein